MGTCAMPILVHAEIPWTVAPVQQRPISSETAACCTQWLQLIWLNACALCMGKVVPATDPTGGGSKSKGKTMRKSFMLAGAAVLAGSLSAWAAETGSTA